MGLFVLAPVLASPGAWAADYVLEAVAVGDFDCSGVPGHAELWSFPETGDIAVVLTFRTPEKELPDPFSGSDGWSVAFSDRDRDGCEELEIVVKSGDKYLVSSVDHEELVRQGQGGAGDSEPDMHVMLKKPLSFPTGTLDVGLFEPWCDYFEYCWTDECYNTCADYGWVGSYPCGVNEDGQTLWCNEWGCTAWKQHCI